MTSENDNEERVDDSNAQPDGDQDHTSPEGEALLIEVAAALPADFELDQRRIKQVRKDRLVPVCSPVFLAARARQADGTGWCHVYRFLAADGAIREVVVPARQLLGSPAKAVGALVDQGFEVWARISEVCTLLHQMETPEIREAVDVTGWVGTAFDTFVMPDGTILSWTGKAVEDGSARFVYSGRPRQAAASRGTVSEWSEDIQGKAKDNTALTVGSCIAVAPALLSYTGGSSFMLHLSGNEDENAVCRAVAASVWGAPGALEVNWALPARELVAEVRRARDGFLIISGYEVRYARKVVEVNAALAARDGTRTQPGRVVILSTGAVPMKDTGSKQVLSDLQAVIDIDTQSWPISYANQLPPMGTMYYGTAGSAALKALITMAVAKKRDLRGSTRIRCTDMLDVMCEYEGQSDADIDCVSQALGTLNAVENLLVEHRILRGRTAHESVVFGQLGKQWVAQHRGLLPEDERALLAAVAGAVAAREHALVSLENDNIRDTADRDGWLDGDFFYLATRTMAELAHAAGQKPEHVVALLNTQGLLKPGNERGLKFRMTSHIVGRPRAYRVSRDLLRFDRRRDQVETPVEDASVA